MFTALAIIAALIAPQQQQDTPSPTIPGPEAAAWVKANAIAFTTPVAGSGFDDLKGLDAIVGDARVVSLGEPTHGTREAFQMKHRILEYLVEKKGFSIFSIEASMPEAYRLNEYVIDGKGDPRQLIAGMYFWTWNTEEVLAMVEWMRAWNEKNPGGAAGAGGDDGKGKPRLQFTGFDMQTPDVAWKIAGEFMGAHAIDLAEKNADLLRDVRAVTAAGSLGSTQRGGTSATGSFPVNEAKGKKLRFSCWIRTEGVTGWAGAWWRCDTPAGVNGFNNMEDQGITGTTDWARHEFTIDVPAETQNINFGFILRGDGAAWFDDVEIELDGAKYVNPTRFSFDFENDAVKYLSGGSGQYSIKRSEDKPHAGKKSLELRRRADVPDVDRQAVLARATAVVTDLTARRDELVKKAGVKDTDWAIQNARVVAQCASMYARQGDGFNARDESMALNVRWILDQNPGQKVVLWAHNGHVGKVGIGQGLTSMGAQLVQPLGQQMVVFGFATGTGDYTAAAQGSGVAPGNKLVAPGEGSVEAVFMESGLPNAILDIRKANADNPASRWLTQVMAMRSIGALAMDAQFYPCTPKNAYDVLVWQRETTSARTLK